MRSVLRLVIVVLLVEVIGLARSRSEIGPWLPDFAIALVAAIALAGKESVVVRSALLLGVLRAPTTAADPLSGVGAFLAFGLLVLHGRRFVFRDHAAVAFGAGILGAVLVFGLAAAADHARGAGSGLLAPSLGAAASTGALTVLVVPTLRRLSFTRSLLERRFGE